ncbi:MAG: DUF4397 domain-containing protein, partial [Bacillota bacterium]|nr:DUF4397 domain-containing protein [Bacillota bacterium]
MPDQKWYETSEDMQMPLPLTKEEAEGGWEEDTEERQMNRGRYPSITLPNQTHITVIPIIPGITMLGYIRFLNASPAEQNVDIYVNGRRVAENLLYRDFTEYRKVFPGWYRIAVYRAGTRREPLTVTTLEIGANDIATAAVKGLAEDIAVQIINDSRRWVD